MWFFGGLLLSIAMFFGCSNLSKSPLPPVTDLMPPNYSLENTEDINQVDLHLKKMAISNTDKKTYWWTQFKRGQIWADVDPEKSCEIFASLSKDKLFPLHNLALLRTHQYCSAESPILANVDPYEMDRFDEWLTPFTLDISINKALSSGDKITLGDLYLQKSKLPLSRPQKVHYAEEALKLAKELGDKRKIKYLDARIYKLAPSLEPKPSRSNYLNVAFDYRRHRQFDEARTFYRKVLNYKGSSFHNKIIAYKGIADTFKIESDRKTSLKVLNQLARYLDTLQHRNKKSHAINKLYYKYSLVIARARWTQGQTQEARKYLRSALKKLPKNIAKAEAYWVLGRIDEETKLYKQAIWWFEQALGEKIHDLEFKDKITWYLAWNQLKLDRKSDAYATLSKLAANAQNPYDRAKFTFWKSKLAKALGEKNWEDGFTNLLAEDSHGYYGLLSFRELGKPISVSTGFQRQVASSVTNDTVHPDVAKHLDTIYFDWLISLEESDIAKKFLGGVAKNYFANHTPSVESSHSLLKLFARSGLYQDLFFNLGKIEPSVRKLVTEQFPEILFPRPYLTQVSSSAKNYGVSPEFIYSIMRQESGFNPKARSPMDAFGLMQMLPRVAKTKAKNLGLPFANAEDLYKPEISVALGSVYLKELMDRFDGQWILAVASYNAPERAIRTWMKTRFEGDTLKFIEDIPYDETKSYVKLVLRNLIYYQLLNSESNKLEFPEWTLALNSQDN